MVCGRDRAVEKAAFRQPMQTNCRRTGEYLFPMDIQLLNSLQMSAAVVTLATVDGDCIERVMEPGVSESISFLAAAAAVVTKFADFMQQGALFLYNNNNCYYIFTFCLSNDMMC